MKNANAHIVVNDIATAAQALLVGAVEAELALRRYGSSPLRWKILPSAGWERRRIL